MNYNISRIEKEKENTLRSLKDSQVQMFMEKNHRDFLEEHIQINPPMINNEKCMEYFEKEKEYREIFFNQSSLRGYYADNGIIMALLEKLGDIALQSYFNKLKFEYMAMLNNLRSLIENCSHLLFLFNEMYLQIIKNIDYQLIIANHNQHMKESEELDFDDLDWEEDLIEYVKNDLKYNKNKYELFSDYLKNERINPQILVKYLFNNCISLIKELEEQFDFLDEMYFEENIKNTKDHSPNAHKDIVNFKEYYDKTYDNVKEDFYKYREYVDKFSEEGFSIAKEVLLSDDIEWNREYYLKIRYNMKTFEIEGMEFLDDI